MPVQTLRNACAGVGDTPGAPSATGGGRDGYERDAACLRERAWNRTHTHTHHRVLFEASFSRGEKSVNPRCRLS